MSVSSEQTFSTSDLRSNAQDYKRDAARKHKWQFGPVERVGRAPGNVRPLRADETMDVARRRESKGKAASWARGAKGAHNRDVVEGNSVVKTRNYFKPLSDESESLPISPPSADVMYSFDAPAGPSHGSQILNSALAKAVEKFEETETSKLVKAEYDVINIEGETVAPSPVKKARGKAKAMSLVVVDEDEDYEFV